MALSIAVAGKRDLNGQDEELERRLREIFSDLARSLGAIRASDRTPHLADRFDMSADARLTLVTGLADGADQVAANAFLAGAALHPTVRHVLGAILPCNRDDFVANSAVSDTRTFAAQYDAAAFVIELDGEMPPRPEAGVEATDIRQAREYAFKAQSTFLLRHADVLIAVDAPQSGGRTGGTQDTIRSARERAIPVILVQLDGSVSILQTPRDFDRPSPITGDLPSRIEALVETLIEVAGPQDPIYVASLLEKYFAADVPGDSPTIRAWRWFESRFKPDEGSIGSPGGPPQDRYRLRASALARRYAGLYRGTILIGYALAVIAVGLAVGALVTMLRWPEAHDPTYLAWWLIVVLAVLKFATLTIILMMIETGNRHRLAHRAADYRYLSERLRSMIYLPLVGSLRPPPNPSRPYSTRVVSQGVMDRLFDAVVRQMDPATVMHPRDRTVIRPDATAALKSVKLYWLDEQLAYHGRNKQTLETMSARLEVVGRRLNKEVIAIVTIDLVIIMVAIVLPELLGPLAHGPLALVLVSLAAILPAAVASLNGIRFQTECARLSDRSAQMSVELQHIQASLNEANGPVRLVEVLHFVEDISRLTLDEVADWSGIYGKELVDP